MLSSKEIRNVTFANSVGGYRKEEVDILLDKIEVDYDKYEKLVATQSAKIEELQKEIENYKDSQSSIQNVLLSAQKLADQIVDEAKEKSKQIINEAEKNIVDITEKGKMLAGEFDSQANEKKEKLESDLADIIKKAEDKKAVVEKVTSDCVDKQQELFNALKAETAKFRKEITEKYKEHLALLSTIPAEFEVDPKAAAKMVEEEIKEAEEVAEETEEITEEAEEEISDEEISNDAEDAEEEQE